MNAAVTRGHWHIPWLRGLPTHWEVVSSKQLFSVRKELARKQDQQLAATQAYGVISQKEFERRVGRRVVQITQNLEKRRHVEKDDFVISMRSFQGGLERAWEAGCIRSSYVVLKPSARVDAGFFQYLLKSHDYVQALQATSNFIRDGQDLNLSNFALVDLPLPPKDEQRLRARFLDWHGAQTTKLVRANKKIIALLNEQKQAIIHRAVTRGLDPNVRLKPSGLDWLGDMPAHWEVRRNGRLFKARRESGFPDLPILEVSIRNGVRIRDFGSGERKQEMSDRSKYQRAVRGDIAYNMMRMWQGAVGIAPSDGLVSPAYVVARPFSEVNAAFYTNLFRTAAYMREVDVFSRGIVPDRNRLYWESFKQIASPYPPLDEQEAIARAVDAKTAEMRSTLSAIDREIAFIQEFRTRLIADVVTGKLDVCAAAASLPEVTEPESVGDLTEVDDLDEAVDDLENEEVAA